MDALVTDARSSVESNATERLDVEGSLTAALSITAVPEELDAASALNRCRSLSTPNICGNCIYSHAGDPGESVGACSAPVFCPNFTVAQGVVSGESFFGGGGVIIQCDSGKF